VLFSSSSENPLNGATVVWFQDGLFNARIGMFQAGPVHPRTRARRNRRDSCEKPAITVVWSRKNWLAVGQGSQQHLTTLSARPDLRRGQGPSVATHTHPHDAGRALTFGTLAASAMMRTSASSPRGCVLRNRLRWVIACSQKGTNESRFRRFSKTSSPRETACLQASRDWNTRPPCRIVIEVIVPVISSPVAALRGVTTLCTRPWSVIEERRAHRGSAPLGVHEAESVRGASGAH
jgi:hypothetical protein